MAIDYSVLKNATIKWAASEALGLDEGEIEVPYDVSGRVDIWKVPVSDADPDGIFVGVSSGSWYHGVEPGCCAWEKKLLAKIRFSGVPLSSESMSQNTVEFSVDGFDLSSSDLNPNDYSSMFNTSEEK